MKEISEDSCKDNVRGQLRRMYYFYIWIPHPIGGDPLYMGCLVLEQNTPQF